MKQEEYDQLQKHLGENFGKADKRKKPDSQKPEDPAKKRRRDATSNRTQKLRKTKCLLDQIHNEMAKLKKDCEKLRAKSFPEAMVEWCIGKITDFEDHDWDSCQRHYNQEVVKVQSDSTEIAEIEASAQAFDVALQKLQASWSSWQKGSGNEIKKLCG